jgi:hypothetical protein
MNTSSQQAGLTVSPQNLAMLRHLKIQGSHNKSFKKSEPIIENDLFQHGLFSHMERTRKKKKQHHKRQEKKNNVFTEDTMRIMESLDYCYVTKLMALNMGHVSNPYRVTL